MNKCACCGTALPAEAKVRLCPECFHATSVSGMYTHCKKHNRPIQPDKNTE